ncbi:MAG: fibrobacter succinogenes major paralogous domain-containing protein [Bacteroidota bacterium]
MKTKIKATFKLTALLSILLLIGSCKPDKNPPVVAQETGTVTDIDGNSYKTIKIGNQWWMAENLKVTKFRNGNIIPDVTVDTAWQNNTPACCLYQNNTDAPGLLYNWFAVTDTENIAPEGWHIPTDEEWKELERYIGMTNGAEEQSGWRGTNEADKLKAAAPTGWSPFENVWGSDSVGFTALAGSCRRFDGEWGEPGLFATGFWWTASAYSSTEAWFRYLDYKKSNVFRSSSSKNYGYSIRCVKD